MGAGEKPYAKRVMAVLSVIVSGRGSRSQHWQTDPGVGRGARAVRRPAPRHQGFTWAGKSLLDNPNQSSWLMVLGVQ
jgi:hypothetical protein